MTIQESSSSRSHKLLAVDDVPDNLFLVQAALNEEDGYEVNCVDSGRAALEIIANSPPDLILLDIMMPEMSGYDVTRKVRQNPRLSHIPILLFTAQDDIDQRSALEAGADGFIRKPFDIDHLVDKIEDVLQKKAAA